LTLSIPHELIDKVKKINHSIMCPLPRSSLYRNIKSKYIVNDYTLKKLRLWPMTALWVAVVFPCFKTGKKGLPQDKELKERVRPRIYLPYLISTWTPPGPKCLPFWRLQDHPSQTESDAAADERRSMEQNVMGRKSFVWQENFKNQNYREY
jgi:hypothetical protein